MAMKRMNYEKVPKGDEREGKVRIHWIKPSEAKAL